MGEISKQHHPLHTDLVSIVGETYVTDELFARRAYTRTASWIRGRTPGIVAKPGTPIEVSEILKLANKTGTPVIPRGGGVSTLGFPLSDEAERSILVDMTRMNKVLYLDEENMAVGAECGVILSDLSFYIRKRGFHVHTADVPQYVDTLGGVLSGYHGGGCPSDYGASGETGRYVLGLEVVLPTGEIITTGSGPGTNIYQERVINRWAGSPDTTGMFIGDAGVFGIKTKAHLQILKAPPIQDFAVFRFASFDGLWRAMSKLTTVDPIPYNVATAIFPERQGFWSIFCAIRAYEQREIEIRNKIIEEICADGEKVSRELAMEIIRTVTASRQIGKYYGSRGICLNFEHVFRKTDAPEYLDKQRRFVSRRLKEANLDKLVLDRVEYFGPKEHQTILLGTMVFFDENALSNEQKEEAYRIVIEELQQVLESGGFVSQTQGFGTTVGSSAWSPTYRAFMRSLKRAVDPNNILNPGLWRL